MSSYVSKEKKARNLYVGLDVHLRNWSVTVRDYNVELKSAKIPGDFDSLSRFLSRYRAHSLTVVYEAGFLGFWLHDLLTDWGAKCIVTPPSLVPTEHGNRVKTDKRDSKKLSFLLSKGMLKEVWVPEKEARYARQVIRRRQQLIQDRTRVQNRIKGELHCYGVSLGTVTSSWSKVFVGNLWRLTFDNEWMKESFHRLLEEYEFLNSQIRRQTDVLRRLSHTEDYQCQVNLLRTIPGIGLISAMEILLEIGDMSRFRKGDRLTAYVGLTPSQYSSGDKVRMGRITRIGKSHLRGTLIESAWILIRKDKEKHQVYDRIKLASGSRRAIVAVARRLLLCARRMLLDNTTYKYQKVA